MKLRAEHALKINIIFLLTVKIIKIMKKILSVIALVAALFVLSSCVKQTSSGSAAKTLGGIKYSVSYFYEKAGCGKGDLSASVSLSGLETTVKDVKVTFDEEEIFSEETMTIPWEESYNWKVKDGKHTLAFSFETQNGVEGHATIVFEMNGSSSSVSIFE